MTPLVLVLGTGGREHALASRLALDPGWRVAVAPGNEFMAREHWIPKPDAQDGAGPAGWAALAARQRADLVVVGPEAPLAAGLVDTLRALGQTVYGPVRAAARLESSKAFAKDVMRAAGIATADAEVCDTTARAERALDRFGPPYVVKADGLAGGKGVVVTADGAAARAFAADCLGGPAGDGGNRVVIEQFLDGEEASVMAVCDGERHVLLPAARDYKRAFDGDRGPNTGGMGAVAPASAVDAGIEREVSQRIVAPLLREMAARGTPYRGTLYCGLMIGRAGVRVVEFNARFGDPETQAILPLVAGNFAELLAGAARGELDLEGAGRRPGAAVSVALVAEAHPGAAASRSWIDRLEAASNEQGGISVQGAGIVRGAAALPGVPADRWLLRGGRAAFVTAVGDSVAEARERAYGAVARLGGRGWRCRGDIGRAAAVGGPPPGALATDVARS